MEIIILFCIAYLVTFLFIPWLGFFIYYKPLYSLFKNNIFLSFCLYMINKLLLFSLIIFCVNVVKANIIINLLLLIIFVLFYNNIIEDIIFIKREKYKKIKCNLNSLRKIYVRYRPCYEITGIEEKDAENEIIRMDFYQYEKILKKQMEDINGIMVVYYLPNTKIMLNKNIQ
jgi:hypothetical protein